MLHVFSNKTASVLAKVTAANIVSDPWPHVVIQDALPDDLYTELLNSRPSPDRIIDGRPAKENSRYDIPACKSLVVEDISSIWKDFISYHVSVKFWNEILRVFGNIIKETHPAFEINEAVGTRFIHPTPILLDCQIGINTQAPSLSRVRGPHIDNSTALFAGLLYMGDTAGGDLLLQKWKGPRYFADKFETIDAAVETVKCVPYRHNTFVGFINSVDTVHAVTPRQSSEFRLLCNFVIDSAKGKIFRI